MFGDRERISRIRAEQERALAHYIRREVYPYSDHYRPLFENVGLRRGRVRAAADLARLPVTTVEDAALAAGTVLVPDDRRLASDGDRALALRLIGYGVTGRGAEARRTLVDPLYRPLLWTLDGPLVVAWTAADLERLGELGRRWLELAGTRTSDTIVSVLAAEAGRAFWQLQLGARRGGVSLLPLGRRPAPSLVMDVDPTVLAGRAADVADALLAVARTGGSLPLLRTVLVVEDLLLEPSRARLAELAAEVAGAEAPAVVSAWAPPGARAIWSECRGGAGFHTWPAAEVVQVVAGKLVWSALDWRGTALLRVATGVRGVLDESPCRACGRTTPRVFVRLPPGSDGSGSVDA